MLLGQLLKSVGKKYQNIQATGISFDSRKVKKGYIFFAIQGNKTSGVKFINDAVKKGASVIIADKKIKFNNNKIPLILVKSSMVSKFPFVRRKVMIHRAIAGPIPESHCNSPGDATLMLICSA